MQTAQLYRCIAFSLYAVTMAFLALSVAAKSPEREVAAIAVSMSVVTVLSAFTKVKDTRRADEIFKYCNE